MSNVVWHHHDVNVEVRSKMKGQKPCVFWFIGLSGSGKSTVSNIVEQMLTEQGRHTYLLDGDNVRHGLCGDLGFTDGARTENIRRVGEVSKLMIDAGLVVLSAFVSPFKADRHKVRELLPNGQFFEVFVDTPLEECERRDPKGMYKKARAGQIKDFTGIDSPFEVPTNAEIHIQTLGRTPEECALEVIEEWHALQGVVVA